jgi:AcrR family transcriptional regulator
MGRPKEFDVEEALSSAMNVFWSQGFKAASLSDLTTSMEISKSSFYETFGSKHDLFYRRLIITFALQQHRFLALRTWMPLHIKSFAPFSNVLWLTRKAAVGVT